MNGVLTFGRFGGKHCTRRFLTIMELLIVITLIGLIIGALAYNYTGVLDRGKAFKTRTSMEKIQSILSLAIAESPDRAGDIVSSWQEVIRRSPLVKNPNDLIRDGWGYEYQVNYNQSTGEITVDSEGLRRFEHGG
ncbi:MAG: general secretion pathway protein GspG [Chlamydiia bacterium]|nr:general secretion pathway protein GspG [Chlamydiia bacterium]